MVASQNGITSRRYCATLLPIAFCCSSHRVAAAFVGIPQVLGSSVRPAARVFMDAKQSSRLTRLLVPVDPDAPCTQWQAMARLAGMAGAGEREWRCERAGEETIEGRSAIAFRAVSDTGEAFVGWIDRERKFPLQIRTGDGGLFTLEKIKDGALPESSFELPAGARKFSPEALIERIKQSDVWVARPEDR